MNRKYSQALRYLFSRFVLRRRFLLGKEDEYGLQFKFKTEDVVGRNIFKNGKYERDISEFIAKNIKFKSNDIALDIGANIGWYSMLLNKLMPDTGRIFAFEPDPFNFSLLSENILLNQANNVCAINKAVSDKREFKTLYLYSNRNLGRHSLLDINKGSGIRIETVQLDEFLQENNIDLSRVKFVKIDIEGYEFFALSGGEKVLNYVECLICEFMPDTIKRGGLDPNHLIRLLEGKSFKPHVYKAGQLSSVRAADLLHKEECDIIWLKD